MDRVGSDIVVVGHNDSTNTVVRPDHHHLAKARDSQQSNRDNTDTENDLVLRQLLGSDVHRRKNDKVISCKWDAGLHLVQLARL
jgi:hypothetical protein